jgi:iron complex transport system permease protein
VIVAPARLRAGPLLVACAGLAGAALLAVLVGPVRLDPGAVLAELAGHLPLVHTTSGLSQQEAAILWELRLPRVVLGGLVGAMLAVAGVAYQGVFRNPLADPYLLGVAAGAGFGATLAIVSGASTDVGFVEPLPLAAFAGALAAVGLTYLLGAAGDRFRSPAALILAGVAVASFLTALQTYVQQRESETLRDVYAWLLGRLSTAHWDEVRLLLPYAVITAVVLLAHRRALDVLSVGDEEAAALGLHPKRTRLVVVIVASLGAAAAVSVSGLIIFVGIIVPHTIRLVAGTSYRVIIPLSLLLGGAFLAGVDLLARTVVAPAELPLGVVTAFFGAPFFAVVLRSSRRATA